MKIKEIIQCLEAVAPLSLQENYDNAGLIVGNENDEVQQALLTLDCTEAVVDEAIKHQCGIIIAHHPIVFKGLKKLNGKNYVERVVIKAIQHKIAIYAIHTNLDSVANGVNAKIAQKLGLQNCKILAPKSEILNKIETFVPTSHLHQVADALFKAGAGNIGNYSECSFQTEGKGTFKAHSNAHPFMGEIGARHTETEQKLELIYPDFKEKAILKALIEAHPYEEVAYYCTSLSNTYQEIGSGMVGYLPAPVSELEMLQKIQNVLDAKVIRHTELLNKKVHKVAICGGSGSFLLQNALHANADMFITADFKYHEFFDAENKLVIADIGHFETEQFTSELLLEIITKNFPNFVVRLSEINTNPIKYFI